MAEKKLFEAIEAIEAQIEATHTRRRKRQEELLLQHLRDREPLLQRRYELVTGRSEASADELQGFKPQGAAAAAAPEHGAGAGSGKNASSRGLPYFWLNVLCNVEELALLITARDRYALEYLEDVRYERGPAGMLVEFHFAANNPYFTNKVLRKGIYVKRAAPAGGSSPAGHLGEIEEVREEATVIDWKPGRSLLVRLAEQSRGAAGKAKKGEEGQKQRGVKKAAQKQQPRQKGGGGKGKKGKGAGAALPSRSKRHHGKHSGPAPDLPDPEDEDGLVEMQQPVEDEGVDDGDDPWGEEEEEEGARAGRRRPCASFFRFFLPIESGKMHRRREVDPTAVGEDDDDDDEEDGEEEEAGEEDDVYGTGGGRGDAEARRSRDSEILDVIIKVVVPRAVHLYLTAVAPGSGKGAATRRGGGAAAGGATGGGDEGDEEEEEEGYHVVSGSPAGDVASLALGAQRVLHTLVGIQRNVDALCGDLKRGEWEAQVEQAKEVARLAAQRRTLLVGPAGATTGKLSIPAFWLRALRSTDVGSSAVQHRDERALAALADVRLVWDLSRMPTPEEPTRCADLELEFLPNPYFTNTVIRKRFTFNAPGGSLNKLNVQTAQADPIDWQPDRDLTVRRGAATGASSGRAGRARQVPSFFAFFSNAQGSLCRAFNIPGQSRTAQAEALQAQEEFLGEIINALVYIAGRLAAESYVDVNDLGDEGEDDEENEEEEDEEEDEEVEEGEGGEEDAAARRAARRAAARAVRGGRRKGADGEGGGGGGLVARLGSGGVIMGAFILIMLMAQVLVFLESLEYVRGRFKWAA